MTASINHTTTAPSPLLAPVVLTTVGFRAARRSQGSWLWLIAAGFRGVNSRLDALVGHVTALDGSVKGLDGRMNTLDGRMDTLDGRMDTLDGRMDTLDGRVDTLDGRVGALDTGLRAALGELEAHVDEVRDALLADSLETRDSARIQIEDLRSDLKVYADGVIAHTGQLENHETRITKLETR